MLHDLWEHSRDTFSPPCGEAAAADGRSFTSFPPGRRQPLNAAYFESFRIHVFRIVSPHNQLFYELRGEGQEENIFTSCFYDAPFASLSRMTFMTFSGEVYGTFGGLCLNMSLVVIEGQAADETQEFFIIRTSRSHRINPKKSNQSRRICDRILDRINQFVNLKS